MSAGTENSAPGVALLLPGQGAQHPRMAAGLYGHEAVFTAAMDEAFALLGDDGRRIRAEWLAHTPSDAFDDVTVAQPLLYAVDHALGRMVLSWGGRPVALLGHSVGELVAATLAGVVAFEDGIRLMRDRVRQFAGTPAGGMLAVAASPEEIDGRLDGDVHLAAVNARRQLLLAGERAALDRAAAALREQGIACRDARARQAFHTPIVRGAVEASMADWLATPLRRPRLPVYSAYTRGVLTDEDALDHRFWARQPAETVYFAPALDQLLADHDCLLVETGPGNSLTALARRHPAVARGRSAVVPLLPEGPGEAARDRVATAAAKERALALRLEVPS